MAAVRKTGTAAVTVPRKTAAEMGDSIGWLFSGWKRVLARAGAAISPKEPLMRTAGAFKDAACFVREPTALGDAGQASVVHAKTLGLIALLVGAAGGIAVGRITSGSLVIPAAQALGMLIWAGARLAILLALAPRGIEMRRRTSTAWAASLIPFAFAATEGLRLLALLASAWLCLRALEPMTGSPRTARSMVLWAFGGQLGVVALGWLLRGGIAAIASLF